MQFICIILGSIWQERATTTSAPCTVVDDEAARQQQTENEDKLVVHWRHYGRKGTELVYNAQLQVTAANAFG